MGIFVGNKKGNKNITKRNFSPLKQLGYDYRLLTAIGFDIYRYTMLILKNHSGLIFYIYE